MKKGCALMLKKFNIVPHMLIAESSSFHYSLAVFAINRECNCETQTVLEISGRTSIFIDVKPFMRCIREPASQTPKINI